MRELRKVPAFLRFRLSCGTWYFRSDGIMSSCKSLACDRDRGFRCRWIKDTPATSRNAFPITIGRSGVNRCATKFACFFSSFLVSSGKHCDRALIIEASDTVSHEIITSCTLRMLLTGRLRRCRRKVYGNSEKLREKRFRSSEDSRTRLLVTYFYMYMFASVYLVYRIYLCRRKPWVREVISR